MQHLSFETAYSVLKNIAKYTPADFEVLGITDQQFQLTAGERNWARDELHIVMRTLDALIYGTIEVLGLPKMQVPAEHTAAVVAALIARPNQMTACIWLSQQKQVGPGALELAARGQSSNRLEPASADQLFALVQLLGNGHGANNARKDYAKRLGIELEKAQAIQ